MMSLTIILVTQVLGSLTDFPYIYLPAIVVIVIFVFSRGVDQ